MLELRSLTKSFASKRVVDDVLLTVASGEIVALLGPSGCGKSTLLSLVAGLETPDIGEMRWADENLNRTPTHQRQFGLMFQDYALFPHKSVFENVAFGLQMLRHSRIEIEREVRDALALVGLSDFERRDVNTLSGGEQQRVALARALAPRPRLLMLDEPLGALDKALRVQLLDDLRKLLRGLRQTTLYVTHDQEEAFALADRVAVMNAGRLVQVATPEDLYAHPASVFVARFLGLTNLLPVQTIQGQLVVTALGTLQVAEAKVGSTLLIRPNAATVHETANRLRGQVVARAFRGLTTQVVVVVREVELSFEMGDAALPAVGEGIELGLDPHRLLLVAD